MSLCELYDLNIEENRMVIFQRAFFDAIKYETDSVESKSSLRKILKIESKEKLISKSDLVEFNSSEQLASTAQMAFNNIYKYFKFDMTMEERCLYLEQSSMVMLKLNLDLSKFSKLFMVIVARLKLFFTTIVRPGYGRTITVNTNGNTTTSYNKDLVNLYEKLVRAHLIANVNVVLRGSISCISNGPCILYNLGLDCNHYPLCDNDNVIHVKLSHFCLQCGRSNNQEISKDHPLVECIKFRATWRPCALESDWNTRTFTRPKMADILKKKQEAVRRRRESSFRGGRGRGRPGGGRGRGRVGSGNGGNNQTNNNTSNNSGTNGSQSQQSNAQSGRNEKKTSKKDNNT